MVAYFDLGYKNTLRRPFVLKTNNQSNSPTPKDCFHATPRVSGFYELFDTREKLYKPCSRYINGSYGYEKVWRPARGKVEGAGVSSLGSDMTSRQPEQWRPSIKYIDPGTGTWIYDQPWRSSRKHVKPKEHNSGENEARCTRKKFVMEKKHPDAPEWPPPRGPGTFLPRPEWEPPFRKGNNDELKPLKHPRKHSESYRDEYESSGVKNSLDLKASLPQVLGKKRLPTYQNEQLSYGVGAALKFPNYHPAIIL